MQSVALRLIVDREVEIERFKPQEYWSVDANMTSLRGESFVARIAAFEGKKLKRLDIPHQEMAHAARDAIKQGKFTVSRSRSQAHQTQSAAALHDLDAAAGSRAQTRL